MLFRSEAIARLIPLAPAAGADGASAMAPCRVVNIAGGAPVELLDYVAAIERAAGRPALRRELPMQAGDMQETAADTALLSRLTGFTPAVRVEDGVRAFVEWYRDYFAV